jgi:hypothetical protein
MKSGMLWRCKSHISQNDMGFSRLAFSDPTCEMSRQDSDLDILIELEEPPRIDLLDLVNLERYLSDLLGVKVDVALKTNLRKRIGKRILEEAISI